jgi:type II secretory pathway predicted ATPase ExeA
MYTHYFGLNEKPFAIAPNPRHLYLSELHREALAHLVYGIRSDGCFILLTGEVGTGKTTVCRCFLEKLPEDIDVAIILNPKLTAIDLLRTICEELSIHVTTTLPSSKSYIDAINRYLLQAHADGRSTVLVIDEAQNLNADVLEQLRLLTNLETDTQKLLKIVPPRPAGTPSHARQPGDAPGESANNQQISPQTAAARGCPAIYPAPHQGRGWRGAPPVFRPGGEVCRPGFPKASRG